VRSLLVINQPSLLTSCRPINDGVTKRVEEKLCCEWSYWTKGLNNLFSLVELVWECWERNNDTLGRLFPLTVVLYLATDDWVEVGELRTGAGRWVVLHHVCPNVDGRLVATGTEWRKCL